VVSRYLAELDGHLTEAAEALPGAKDIYAGATFVQVLPSGPLLQ
jgi:hypothetical protein